MAIPGWNYVRPITISNSGSALTDYQVLVSNPIYNETGLVVSWHFDEGSGTTAYDTSGNGNNGLVNGSTWVDGKFGKALSFDGVDDYVIKNPISNFPTSEITTVFWIKTTDSDDGIISYATSSSDNDWLILDSSNINIYRGSNAVSSGVAINDNQWHHIAVTWRSSDGSVKLYKDGNLAYSGTLATGTSIAGNGSLVIAQEQDTVGGGFQVSQAHSGLIDEVRIYNRALSAGEINSLYQAKAKPNYGDIRFTDGNGVNLLNYWMEADGKFWVKVPSIPAGTKTIYVYYGNPNATSASNGSATFIFFDDFLGNALDTTKWTIQRQAPGAVISVNNSYLTLKGSATSPYDAAIVSNSFGTMTTPFIIETQRFQILQSPTYRNRFYGYTTNGYLAGMERVAGGNQDIGAFYDGSNAPAEWYVDGFTNVMLSTSKQYHWRYTFTPSNNIKMDVWDENKTLVGSWYGTVYEIRTGDYVGIGSTTTDTIDRVYLGANEQASSNFKVDWIRVRKYASPEPTTSVGSETPTVRGSFLLTFLDQL